MGRAVRTTHISYRAQVYESELKYCIVHVEVHALKTRHPNTCIYLSFSCIRTILEVVYVELVRPSTTVSVSGVSDK